ncbi:aminodeoxychorismate lyase [Salinifilum ghardaiensis]
MRLVALLDGSLVDPETPLLRADDLAATRGDGVFETVLVVDGAARELQPHLERMERSARMLDMPSPDRAAWQRAVDAVVDAWPWQQHPEVALKLICGRGVDGGDGTPTAYAMASEVTADTERKRREGVSAVTLERGHSPDLMQRAPWLLLSAKTLSYAVNMAALREAEARGADEVIFTATDGSVLEGPTSNVVLAHGGALRTPPPSTGILRGTTQGALFRAAESAGWTTRVEQFGVEDLGTADGVWLASSVRRITQVHTVDGTRVKADPDLHAAITRLYESNYG